MPDATDRTPLVRAIEELGGKSSLEDLIARAAARGSVPSLEEMNDAFSAIGRPHVSKEAYARALIAVSSAMLKDLPAIEAEAAREYRKARVLGVLLMAVMVLPLATLGLLALYRKDYLIASLPLGYSLICMYAVLVPNSRWIAFLRSEVEIGGKPGESRARYQLKNGLLIVGAGLFFLVGGIWGLSALYDSGAINKGNSPILEVVLMFPTPLLGITLTLWGLGKLFKALFAKLSEDDTWSAP